MKKSWPMSLRPLILVIIVGSKNKVCLMQKGREARKVVAPFSLSWFVFFRCLKVSSNKKSSGEMYLKLYHYVKRLKITDILVKGSCQEDHHWLYPCSRMDSPWLLARPASIKKDIEMLVSEYLVDLLPESSLDT